jgi:hypothetical protein
LTRDFEKAGQEWAQKLKNPLETINCTVTDAGGALVSQESYKYRLMCREILKQGEIECPEPIER